MTCRAEYILRPAFSSLVEICKKVWKTTIIWYIIPISLTENSPYAMIPLSLQDRLSRPADLYARHNFKEESL